jgi:alkaline phosphatase D
MSFNRRSFLKTLSAAVIGTVFLPRILWSALSSWVPVIQGVTSADSTWVTAVVPEGVGSTMLLKRRDGSLISPASLQEFRSPLGKHRVIRAFFTGLSLDEKYVLEVRGASGQLLDQRGLRTFDHLKAEPRLALLSCFDHAYSDRNRGLWREMASHQADAAILMGDTVYVDAAASLSTAAAAKVFWQKYIEAFHSIEFFRLPELIPSFATWDDHDFGDNDADSAYPHGSLARQIWQIFLGQENIPGVREQGPGISSRVRMGNQTVYLMDGRTFRTPKGHANETHWGKEQEEWLFSSIAAHEGPAWIVNGTPIFGGYITIKESFERNHAKNMKWVMSRLRALGKPVVFASGDRHYSELMWVEAAHLGFRTFEITSSSMQSPPRFFNPWLLFPNRRFIAGEQKRNNYVIVEARLNGVWPSIWATCYVAGKQVVFDEILNVG